MSTLSAAQMFAQAQQGAPAPGPIPGAAMAPTAAPMAPAAPAAAPTPTLPPAVPQDPSDLGIMPAEGYTYGDAKAGAPRLSVRDADAQREQAANTQDQADALTMKTAQNRSVLEGYKSKEMEHAFAEHEQAVAQNNAQMEQIVAQSRQAAERQSQRVRMAADAAASSDVKDFWADKSTLGKALGIIAQTMSGAANFLAGQPGAPTPLDKIIATDIEKQKANMQNAQTQAEREESILGQLYKDTGSMLGAQSALTDAAYQKLAAAAKSMANRFGTQEAQQKAEEIIDAMMQKRAENQAKTAQYLTSAGVQQQGQFLDLQKAQEMMQMKQLEMSFKKMPVGFKGVLGSANIPDQDKGKLSQQLGAAHTALDLIEQMKTRNTDGGFIKWFQERVGAEQDQKMLAAELRKVLDLNRLGPNERALLDSLQGGTFLQRMGRQEDSQWFRNALTSLGANIKLKTKHDLETWDGVQVTPDSPFYIAPAKATK